MLCSVDVAVFIFGSNKKLYEYSSSDMRDLITRYTYVGSPPLLFYMGSPANKRDSTVAPTNTRAHQTSMGVPRMRKKTTRMAPRRKAMAWTLICFPLTSRPSPRSLISGITRLQHHPQFRMVSSARTPGMVLEATLRNHRWVPGRRPGTTFGGWGQWSANQSAPPVALNPLR